VKYDGKDASKCANRELRGDTFIMIFAAALFVTAVFLKKAGETFL